MRGYLSLAPSKDEACFCKEEKGYDSPQVGTFAVALDSKKIKYEYLEQYFVKFGKESGFYSEKNYVEKVPYGSLVYVNEWFGEDNMAIVKLCELKNHGKTIRVCDKWAVLLWAWDALKSDESRNYSEFTDWLDLGDQTVINGLGLYFRPQALKDPEKLVYKVEDDKDECDKEEKPTWKKTTITASVAEDDKEDDKELEKEQGYVIVDADLNELVQDWEKNFSHRLGSALGYYTLKVLQKQGSVEGIASLYVEGKQAFNEIVRETGTDLIKQFLNKAVEVNVVREEQNGRTERKV